MSRSWRVLVLGGLVVAAACSSDDDAGSATTVMERAAPSTAGSTSEATTEPTSESTTEPTSEPTSEATTEPTSEATTEPTAEATTAAADSTDEWEQIVPGGECRCADGGEFSFWVRRADPTKVLFFLQGGGACFSAESCDPETGTYKTSTGAEDFPGDDGGIFDVDNDRNPLADYSMVYVPYCTGDVHLGNRVSTYSPELTLSHVGAVNAGAALDAMLTTFPDATSVLVAGESAGSIPTPIYGGRIHDLLPNAAVAVLADSSGAYPNVAGINGLLDSLWGVVDALPDWPETAALTPETWSIPGLFVQAGLHAPEVTMARHDYAFDATQAFFAGLSGVTPDNLVSLIDENEVQIEAGGVNLLSYIAPGDDHTVLSDEGFYSEEVNGEPLLDWVTNLANGRPVSDVHCTTCGP